MKSKTTSYPGFSILFSVGKYRKSTIELEDYSIKMSFLFFTIMVVAKDLNNLLESYLDSLILRIEELEKQVKKYEN
jgi:archaellum component FlaC